jgi:hypothetical protein
MRKKKIENQKNDENTTEKRKIQNKLKWRLLDKKSQNKKQ